MKTNLKQLASFLLIVSLNYSVFSQPGPSWFLNGNITTGTNFLGTSNAQPLQLRTILSQPILFQTTNTERLRITESDQIQAFRKNFTSAVFQPTWQAKFEINDRNGFAFVNNELVTLLRVRGRGAILPGFPTNLPFNPSTNSVDNFTLAEFIQSRNNTADAGIRIQGARTGCSTCNVSFIDFANFDQDNGGAYNMARISAGLEGASGTGGTLETGYLRFYTNQGKNIGLIERMRINREGKVGIGITSPKARLDVLDGSILSHTIGFIPETRTQFAIKATMSTPNSLSTPNANIGISSAVSGAGSNLAGMFLSKERRTGISNYGVYAEAGGIVDPNNDVIAIYAKAIGDGMFAGYFDGDVFINGVGTGSSGQFYISDSMFKQNIDTIPNSLTIISHLKPKTFFFDTSNTSNLKFSSKQQYGLIAQDVEDVLPELVLNFTKSAEHDSLGNITIPTVTYKNLNYNAFIAILIKGSQEQQSIIDSQRNEINQMKLRVSAIEGSNAKLNNNNQNGNELSKLTNSEQINHGQNQTAQLFPCHPNPFGQSTTISYFLPENTSYSFIGIYDLQGKQIQKIPLYIKGNSSIEVRGNQLYKGIFIYSLTVDGELISSKQMVMTDEH